MDPKPKAKRRTELDRTMDRFRFMVSQLTEVFRRARTQSWTHDRTHALVCALREREEYRRMRQYDRHAWNAIANVLWDQIWQETSWYLGPVSGPIHGPNDQWDEEISQLCRIPGALYGGHFWTRTGAVYTDWTCTNEERKP